MRGHWGRSEERNMRRRGDGSGFWMSVAIVSALLVAVWLTPMARADDAAATPKRGVRLSSVTGQVQASLGGQVIADQALENMPLFEGTRLVTGEDGRAEVQFEDGSVARLSPNSSFTITVLKGTGTSGEAEVALEMGLGYFELQGNGQAGAIRVKFGDSAVTSTGFAVIRIDMDEAPGQLAVFSGNVHLTTGTSVAADVHGGQSLKLRGKDGNFTVADTIEPDSWDAWNADRDQALNALEATLTSATNSQSDSSNPAWSDLDANGNWYNVAGQGQVWSPYDASSPDWEPYANGHWVWMPGSGYVWVSDNSWGYMPFSCGMWNWYDSFGWGWSPGMGGCTPYWNNGGAYLMNVGSHPGWWNAPIVPRHEPPHHYPGPIHGRPAPVVAVNRHISAPASLALPARDIGVPVVLAGQTIIPLRALDARPEYGRTVVGGTGAGGASGARPTAAFGVPGSAARTIPFANANARTGSLGAGRTSSYSTSGSHPSYSPGAGGHSAAPASHSSSGGGGGHASTSSSGGGGHASSGGGGGGGGGHSGGGGGGGGGGGSHK